MFGPEKVTTYNIAYKYFSIIPMAFSIIMMPFWSAFTKAWIEKDIFWIKNAVKKLLRVWVLFSVLSIVMLVASNHVYKLWVGKELIVPLGLSAAIAAFVIINSWNLVFVQFFYSFFNSLF